MRKHSCAKNFVNDLSFTFDGDYVVFIGHCKRCGRLMRKRFIYVDTLDYASFKPLHKGEVHKLIESEEDL